jgi:hypothetical protein
MTAAAVFMIVGLAFAQIQQQWAPAAVTDHLQLAGQAAPGASDTSRRRRAGTAPNGVCRMTWVAGADGFKRGWYVVLAKPDTGAWSARVVPSFAALLQLPEMPSVICVDMPIGLPEHTPPGGRLCEVLARSILGPRRPSAFSAVGHQALGCASRDEAHRFSTASGGIGIGAQAWGLAAKLREVDEAMTVERQALVFEVHPEVSFWAMNSQSPDGLRQKVCRRRSRAYRGAGPERRSGRLCRATPAGIAVRPR